MLEMTRHPDESVFGKICGRLTAVFIMVVLSTVTVSGCGAKATDIVTEERDSAVDEAIAVMHEDDTENNIKDNIEDNIEEIIIEGKEEDKESGEEAMKTKYDKNGALHVNSNGKLVNHNGEVVTLHGYSTHGINLYDGYVNREFLEYMRDEWKLDIIRLAMYTEEEYGYCNSGEDNKRRLLDVIDKGVRAATELGLYVIIDWHILSDSNPLIHADEAEKFFATVSDRYASYGNIFYEICNEPNSGCSWQDIKSYSERIIPVIRANDPYAVILVGTPEWSQRLDEAVADPITSDDNLMYVLHFYADTHRDDLRNTAKRAMENKLPVFVSEFGTCAADGGGAHNAAEADRWMELLDKNDISYIMWNISNKDETSAMIQPFCEKVTGDYTDDELREPARWYREVLKRQ